jgi:hypothetical protein
VTGVAPAEWIPATPPAVVRAAMPISRASSLSRPVKLAISRGSARVAAAAEAPAAPSAAAASRAASTSAAGARPRAAATNAARTGPIRPSASASSPAVSLRAVRLTPLSRSLTDRGERLAASASSSCVSPASPRSCRSNPANVPAGSSATSPLIPSVPRPRPLLQRTSAIAHKGRPPQRRPGHFISVQAGQRPARSCPPPRIATAPTAPAQGESCGSPVGQYVW